MPCESGAGVASHMLHVVESNRTCDPEVECGRLSPATWLEDALEIGMDSGIRRWEEIALESGQAFEREADLVGSLSLPQRHSCALLSAPGHVAIAGVAAGPASAPVYGRITAPSGCWDSSRNSGTQSEQQWFRTPQKVPNSPWKVSK